MPKIKICLKQMRSWNYKVVWCFLDINSQIIVSKIYHPKRISRIFCFTHCTVGQMFMNGWRRLAVAEYVENTQWYCVLNLKQQ